MRLSLMLCLLVFVGCATPLAGLAPKQRTAICTFLYTRAQQGDFLGCFLAAQRAAASQADYGRAIHPEVSVEATLVFDRFGQPTALRGLRTSLPKAAARPVLACFTDAFAGTSIPPQLKAVKVPVKVLVDSLEPVAPDAVNAPSGHCLLGPGSAY